MRVFIFSRLFPSAIFSAFVLLSLFLFYIFEMNQIIAENSVADKQKLFTHFQSFFSEIHMLAGKLLGRIEEG